MKHNQLIMQRYCAYFYSLRNGVYMAGNITVAIVIRLNIHNSKNNKSIYTCQHLSNFLYLDNLNLILMKKGWQQIMLYLIVLTSYGCLSDEDKCIRQLVQG